MNKFLSILLFFVTLILLQSCNWDKPFPGETGKIKSYSYDGTQINLINQLDQFLIQNPNYIAKFNNRSALIVEVPQTRDKFEFLIRSEKSLSLIYAGEKGKKLKLDYYLEPDERERLIKSFENNFLNKALEIPIKNNEYLSSPFLLTANKTNYPVHDYVFAIDTLVTFDLPEEFDSLSIDYFKNLIQSHFESMNRTTTVSQYCNLFSINENISGYINNSINITRIYRQIGQPYPDKIFFNDNDWMSFVKPENKENRIKEYNRLRENLVSEGYPATSVYQKHGMAYWMKEEAVLECKPETNKGID